MCIKIIPERSAQKLGLAVLFWWPPSSPDLNPIEKVWRWMEVRITQMEPFPTMIDALKKVVQGLWDELDPCDYIKEIRKGQRNVGRC